MGVLPSPRSVRARHRRLGADRHVVRLLASPSGLGPGPDRGPALRLIMHAKRLHILIDLGTLPIATAAGALSLLAFAPFGWSPLALASPCVLIVLWLRMKPGLAILQGWAAGLGLLLPGT